MKSIELSLKTKKTQYFEAMKASSLKSSLGCHSARHTLKSTQILGFLGQFNKFQIKSILLGQLYKHINFRYNSNDKALQIHSIYKGFAT